MAENTFQEYPKALYASPDQTGPFVTAQDAAEEVAARDGGAKMLAEWWEETGIPDCEAAEWMAKLASKAPAKGKK